MLCSGSDYGAADLLLPHAAELTALFEIGSIGGDRASWLCLQPAAEPSFLQEPAVLPSGILRAGDDHRKN